MAALAVITCNFSEVVLEQRKETVEARREKDDALAQLRSREGCKRRHEEEVSGLGGLSHACLVGAFLI